jgi:hypothetical protein
MDLPLRRRSEGEFVFARANDLRGPLAEPYHVLLAHQYLPTGTAIPLPVVTPADQPEGVIAHERVELAPRPVVDQA